MSKSDTLLQLNRAEISKCINKEFGKSEKDLKELIEIIKEWLQTQNHLPEIPTDNFLNQFLLFNKLSIEKTKQKLDLYYTVRGLIPELFKDKSPLTPEMKKQMDLAYVIPLPKATPDCRRIIYIKITKQCTPNKFDFNNFTAQAFNIAEVCLNEDCSLGFHLIYDNEFLKAGHITSGNPMTLRKMNTVIQKVYSGRVASMHFIHGQSYIDALLNFIKPTLPTKVAERIVVHKTLETLMNYFPKECLPKDVGGEEQDLNTLNDIWKAKFEEYADRFKKLDEMEVNESLRATPLVNDEILGYYGHFKKLDVD